MLVGGEVAVLAPSRVQRSRSTNGNDAEGRGISRRISTRNLLKFSVALAFGEFLFQRTDQGRFCLHYVHLSKN